MGTLVDVLHVCGREYGGVCLGVWAWVWVSCNAGAVGV